MAICCIIRREVDVTSDLNNHVGSIVSVFSVQISLEVLNFFQASLRNCKNCDHNCEDHSSFDFISAVHI